MRHRNPPTLPKRLSTVTRKITDRNPWQEGNSLSQAITEGWAAIVPIASSNYSDFIHKLAAIPAVEQWSKKHHLAPYHVAANIVEIVCQ